MRNIPIAIWFVAICCSFGGLMIWFCDSVAATGCVRPENQFRYETWTDESTGHRFIVVAPRWRDGVGICLIPSFVSEVEEDSEVPEPKILESVVTWPERN